MSLQKNERMNDEVNDTVGLNLPVCFQSGDIYIWQSSQHHGAFVERYEIRKLGSGRSSSSLTDESWLGTRANRSWHNALEGGTCRGAYQEPRIGAARTNRNELSGSRSLVVISEDCRSLQEKELRSKGFLTELSARFGGAPRIAARSLGAVLPTVFLGSFTPDAPRCMHGSPM